MKTEPVAIIEVVRLIAYAFSLFGIIITDEEQQALAIAIGGIVVAVSVILSVIARSKVFSRQTTETLVGKAAATGKIPVALQPGVGPGE